MKTKAKILIYDLEVSPTLGWTYGLYDTRVLRVEKQPIIMSISWRWYGEKKTHHMNLHYSSEEAMVKLIRSLFDEAHILVAHNANRFDNKVATAAFLRYNLSPPSPYKTIDTLRVVKGISRFNSNSLDAIGEELGLGRKTAIKHSDIWYECLQGDVKAWKAMEKYNNQDVDLLYAIYERLKPWIKNHPNMGDIARLDGACPKCGSSDLEKRGFNDARVPKQRYRCNNCHGWCNEATLKGKGRLVNAI